MIEYAFFKQFNIFRELSTMKLLTTMNSRRVSIFDIQIREFEILRGAGFIKPNAGNILRMLD